METHLYVISCLDPGVPDRYIGFTTNWERCLYFHSDEYDRTSERDTLLYRFVREHGGWDNWVMTVIGTYGSREEAYYVKQTFLLKHKFSLNTRQP